MQAHGTARLRGAEQSDPEMHRAFVKGRRLIAAALFAVQIGETVCRAGDQQALFLSSLGVVQDGVVELNRLVVFTLEDRMSCAFKLRTPTPK